MNIFEEIGKIGLGEKIIKVCWKTKNIHRYVWGNQAESTIQYFKRTNPNCSFRSKHLEINTPKDYSKQFFFSQQYLIIRIVFARTRLYVLFLKTSLFFHPVVFDNKGIIRF